MYDRVVNARHLLVEVSPKTKIFGYTTKDLSEKYNSLGG